MELSTPFKLKEKGIVWEDLIIEPTARQLSSTTPLFRQFINGVNLYHFDEVKEMETELFFSVQMPHKWAHTPIVPHVHWSPKVTSGKGENVIWGVEYTWAGINEGFPDTKYIYTDGCNTDFLIEKKHLLSSFGPLEPVVDSFGLSSILVGRLFRNTSNILDNYNASAALLYIDIHYEMNRLGSEEELH